MSRQLARTVLPETEWTASWHEPLSCPLVVMIMDYGREILTLSVGCVASTDVGYRQGSRKWRADDARADASETEMGCISGRGLMVRISVKMYRQGDLSRWWAVQWWGNDRVK